MMELILKPWPWYIAGPLLGLMVPILLLAGNKRLGISSSLRHICAACLPANISFFKYDWKREAWNLFFVTGILLGGLVTAQFLQDGSPIQVHPTLARELAGYGVTNFSQQIPADLFNWHSFSSPRGWILMVLGGLLVGFGTRYAGGCTSGHSIMGLATLQWPSLVATCCFMIGGFIVANLVLPFVLSL